MLVWRYECGGCAGRYECEGCVLIWRCGCTHTHICTGEKVKLDIPKIDTRFTGTGDLFTALLLARIDEGLQVSAFGGCGYC